MPCVVLWLSGGTLATLYKYLMRINEIQQRPKLNYMRGHCHVMAIALKKLHPDWTIRARIGWDDDAEYDWDFKIDHVYAVAPDGSAYDARGRYDNETELLNAPDPDDEIPYVPPDGTEIIDFDLEDIQDAIARKVLLPYTSQDVQDTIEILRSTNKNYT